MCMLIWGADQSRYLKLKDNLSNDMAKGVNNFPKTMVKTLQLTSNYKVPAKIQHIKKNNKVGDFVQEGKVINTKDIKCWHCSKKGNYQCNCPKL